MPKQRTKVVPIRRDVLASDKVCEVVDRAFSLWLENGFWGGSPEDALLDAVQQLSRSRTTGDSFCPSAMPCGAPLLRVPWSP